jgi:hypothetical protein
MFFLSIKNMRKEGEKQEKGGERRSGRRGENFDQFRGC